MVLENKTKPLVLGYFGVVSCFLDNEGEIRGDQALMTEPAFQEARSNSKLGTDALRLFITQLLSNKVEKFLPQLEQESKEELLRVERELEEIGGYDDASDYDDMIAHLVEKTIVRIKVSLDGLSTRVDTEEIGTGASLNEKIKLGVIKASKTARQTYKVQEFHEKLVKAKRNVHGIRDNLLPQELVLEIGVGLLTETYREPMKQLLRDSHEFLRTSIKTELKETMGVYGKLDDLVMEIIQTEIEKNKEKAEEFLDLQVNLQKRFVNSEHEEFRKSTKIFQKGGVRHKNNVNHWFQEEISVTQRTARKSRLSIDFLILTLMPLIVWSLVYLGVHLGIISFCSGDVVKALTVMLLWGLVYLGVKIARGFVEGSLAKREDDDDVHFNKLPSDPETEAQMHLDLCLEYMEIVDKALEDQVAKNLVMMLVHRSLDFFAGGDSYPTSLMRKVQKACKDEEKKKEVLQRSPAYEDLIRNLEERKRVCKETIDVIKQTENQLRNIRK